MQTVFRDGVAIRFRDQGRGPVVLLLHAFPLNGEMFAPQLEMLSKTHRVIVPDQRGFGQSELGDTAATTMEMLADDALAVLSAAGVSKAIIGGVSMGGYAAMALAAAEPSVVQGLILIDTQMGADDAATAAKREETARAVLERGSEVLVETMVPRLIAMSAAPTVRQQVSEMIRSTPARSAAATLRGLALRPDRSAFLASFKGPSLVMVGEHDVITPPEKAAALAKQLRTEVVTIPGAGHLATLENPAPANVALAAFLSRHGTST